MGRGMTQLAVANAVGISANHYSAIAHAHTSPSMTVMFRLASVLGVTMVELFQSAESAGTFSPVPTEELGYLVAALARFVDATALPMRPKRQAMSESGSEADRNGG